MAVKRAGASMQAALRIVLISHILSTSVLFAIAYVRAIPMPHGPPLAWGLAAGVAAGVALTCFYVSLARGAMGRSAALSGLIAAAVPAALALSSDGSPGMRALTGFAVAGVAIWLIAAGPAERSGVPPASGLTLLAVVAGAGFGIYFFALKQANPAGILWPLASSRIGSLITCTAILLATLRRPPAPRIRIDRRTLLWTAAAALLDTTGNLLFVAATRAGRLDIAAVLASLYPASTILLAAFALREVPTRRQALGMATAVVAVALIAL